MFGKVTKTPQNENTPFHPRSAYGISKVTGYDLTRNYREAYNFSVVQGFYLIMSHQEEDLNLLLEKFHMVSQKLN